MSLVTVSNSISMTVSNCSKTYRIALGNLFECESGKFECESERARTMAVRREAYDEGRKLVRPLGPLSNLNCLFRTRRIAPIGSFAADSNCPKQASKGRSSYASYKLITAVERIL